jgi:hypothetical protein
METPAMEPMLAQASSGQLDPIVVIPMDVKQVSDRAT